MTISSVQEQLGTVTGTADRAKLDAIRGVAGVSGVEESQDYQIPPPESEVQ
jgi:hypothetical protein